MTTNFSDRGMRELEYKIIPTGSALQRAIQHAGEISECVDLEKRIANQEKPYSEHRNRDAYNHLAKQLNRRAENPNVGSNATWEKISQDVLKYFDSKLPIYADHDASTLSSPAYILNTRTRQLVYFDGTKTTTICQFTKDADWHKIQGMFPSLFNPSIAVGMGFLSNYTTLKPEKYIELMYLARRINPQAKFETFVETSFLPLYTNLAQHAAIRSLLVQHDDQRTLEQLQADIVKELYAKVNRYLVQCSKNGVEIHPVMQELIVGIVEYLDTGDYNKLIGPITKYDSAWLMRTANMFYKGEVDSTLNIIKEMRQSAFLDQALQKMAEERFGASKGVVYLGGYERKILGRAEASDTDDEEIQRRIENHYGEGATLQGLMQTRLAEKLQIEDAEALNAGDWETIFAGNIDAYTTLALTTEEHVEAATRNALRAYNEEHKGAPVRALGDLTRQDRQELQQQIQSELASQRKDMISKMQQEIYDQIGDEVSGNLSRTRDETLTEEDFTGTENNQEDEYQYQSHIEDFALEAETVNMRWANSRVTKEAMKTTISAMQAKLLELEESATEDGITLPNIPLPSDFVQENAVKENKTIIQHIREYIERLEQKTANDLSKKTDYHADCALLQTAINQILHFQYAGGEEEEIHYVLTEAQRAAYNEVGEELTDILNKTQKQPVKAPEVLKSVVSVRAEIHRLIAFHNEIREKLTGYQTDLLRLDQGSFVNDIKEFTKKGGSLDNRQKELEDLLASIQNTPEDEFNVLSEEKNSWQTQVCAVVDALKDHGTFLANELQNVLLFKPQVHAVTDEHIEPQPREYISVISKAARRKDPEGSAEKDQKQTAKFNKIMEGITEFAETLVPSEASRLATFYEETLQAPKKQGIWSSSTRSDAGSEADLRQEGGLNRPRFGSGDSDF